MERNPIYSDIYDGYITVVSVSWYSSDDLYGLIENLRTYAERPDRLRFILVDNTNGKDETLYDMASGEECLQIIPCDCKGRTGSHAHAVGLQCGMEQVKTEYTLTVDPDVHLFISGWDRIFMENLEGVNCRAVGAPYPWWKLGKYHDYPSPIFALYRADTLREVAADWSPFPSSRMRRFRNLLERLWVRLGPIATRRRLVASSRLANFCRWMETRFPLCAPDTGYRLAHCLRESGADAALLTPVNHREAAQMVYGLSGSLAHLADDFELFMWRDCPAMVHRYSTRSYYWRMPQSGNRERWRRLIREADMAMRRKDNE